MINLKIDDMVFKDALMQDRGIFPAYHMNKEHWITVLLDGTVEEAKVCGLIDLSFEATASKKKKTKTLCGLGSCAGTMPMRSPSGG